MCGTDGAGGGGGDARSERAAMELESLGDSGGWSSEPRRDPAFQLKGAVISQISGCFFHNLAARNGVEHIIHLRIEIR